MKLRNIEDVEGFLGAVEKCKSDVWLESPYGDKYNLKSKLSQYIAMGKLLSTSGDSLELFCADSADEHHFYKFFYTHPGVL